MLLTYSLGSRSELFITRDNLDTIVGTLNDNVVSSFVHVGTSTFNSFWQLLATVCFHTFCLRQIRVLWNLTKVADHSCSVQT